VIGSTQQITVRLYPKDTDSHCIATSTLHVCVVKEKAKRGTKGDGRGPHRELREVVKPGFVPYLEPIGVSQQDDLWSDLGWGEDTDSVGFMVRIVGGEVQVYYNADHSRLIYLKKKAADRNFLDAFIQQYKISLALYGGQRVRNEMLDEDSLAKDTLIRKYRYDSSAVAYCLATDAFAKVLATIKVSHVVDEDSEQGTATAAE